MLMPTCFSALDGDRVDFVIFIGYFCVVKIYADLIPGFSSIQFLNIYFTIMSQIPFMKIGEKKFAKRQFSKNHSVIARIEKSV